MGRFYFFKKIILAGFISSKKFVLAALVQLQLYIFCVSAPAAVSRRLSLDTQRAEKAGRQKEQPANRRRRSSIEVGTLTTGHLGSMIGRMGAKQHSPPKYTPKINEKCCTCSPYRIFWVTRHSPFNETGVST